MLPSIVSGDISSIRNKIPDRKIYWSANLELYLKLGI